MTSPVALSGETTAAALALHADAEPTGQQAATSERGQSRRPVKLALRTDRRIQIVVIGVLAVGALLAAGVPASTLLPLVAIAPCLGMHLFMDHGGHGAHGAGTTRGHDHGAYQANEDAAQAPVDEGRA